MALHTAWILGDQLLERHPAVLAAQAPGVEVEILLIESQQRLLRQPYHRKKLTLLLSAMRHYAYSMEARGCRVRYIRAETIAEGLKTYADSHDPDALFSMEASEWRGRHFQHERLASLFQVPVHVLANTQFLLGQHHPFPDVPADRRIRMETFYRDMRKHFSVLMEEDGTPAGGNWNYDRDNRRALGKGITIPDRRRFQPDALTLAVMDEVAQFPEGVGKGEGFDLAVTHEQAAIALETFLDERLAQFGPYEDAMHWQHRLLFHSQLSPYLNIGLLEPMDVIRAAEERYHRGMAPINSVEGFVRQILGWREYIYWQYWRVEPQRWETNTWDAQRPLPSFFWDGDVAMNCLRTCLQGVLEDGYAHHIERLMLLTNYAMLTGLDPMQVNRWFLAHFIDAYEWVMVPNVIGMGLHADDGRVGSKPYIASANYIRKMGNYCSSCSYKARERTGPEACPYNFLYWNFLLEHEERLRAQPRLGPNVLGLRHLDEEQRTAVREQARAYLADLLHETG